MITVQPRTFESFINGQVVSLRLPDAWNIVDGDEIPLQGGVYEVFGKVISNERRADDNTIYRVQKI